MNTERKSRQFWAEKGNSVTLVTGYECPPNEGCWWVPELGYSMWEGKHLFDSEESALKMAIVDAQDEEIRIQNKLDALRKQLASQ